MDLIDSLVSLFQQVVNFFASLAPYRWHLLFHPDAIALIGRQETTRLASRAATAAFA